MIDGDDAEYMITPQGEAYVEFMLAHPELSTNANESAYFGGGWQARQSEIDLIESTIAEAAELLRDDIVEDDVAIDALVIDAIKRVLSERDEARKAVTL